MLNRSDLFAARYHRAVLIASALLLVVVTILGIGAFKRLQSGGFVSASASSSQAEALVASHFGGEQGLVILISARAGSVSSPALIRLRSVIRFHLSTPAERAYQQVTCHFEVD
jgi:putative drug exporter of the RND superfamily